MTVPVIPSLPIIGHSLPFQRNALKFTSEMQEKYGDVFQISLLNEKFIALLTPEATKDIFLDKDDLFSSKEGWAVSLGPTFENGLMLRDFDDHKYHRTLLQDSFRHDAIHGYLEIIQPIINQWVENLKKAGSFNLYQSVKQLMFDISLSLFFLDVKQDESVKEEVCDVCGKEPCECEDSDDIEEGQFWGQKGMAKADAAKLKKAGAVRLQKKEKGGVARVTLPKGHKDIKKYMKQGYKQIEIESVEEGKGGKYLKYSDLLLKKQRMSDTADKTAINKEIKKERQKLGISEENLEDILIHFLPEQEK